MPVLQLAAIETLCFEALTRAGASFDQASAVALELMDAEAEGIRNVGLGYIHLYLKHLNAARSWAMRYPRLFAPPMPAPSLMPALAFVIPPICLERIG